MASAAHKQCFAHLGSSAIATATVNLEAPDDSGKSTKSRSAGGRDGSCESSQQEEMHNTMDVEILSKPDDRGDEEQGNGDEGHNTEQMRDREDDDISSTAAEGKHVVDTSPSSVFVVLMRVLSSKAVTSTPQAAFRCQQGALTYAMRVLTEFCKNHYTDFIYYGPRQLPRLPTFRYTARDAQTRQRLVVVDVVRVCIFDHGEPTESSPTENQRKEKGSAVMGGLQAGDG